MRELIRRWENPPTSRCRRQCSLRHSHSSSFKANYISFLTTAGRASPSLSPISDANFSFARKPQSQLTDTKGPRSCFIRWILPPCLFNSTNAKLAQLLLPEKISREITAKCHITDKTPHPSIRPSFYPRTLIHHPSIILPAVPLCIFPSHTSFIHINLRFIHLFIHPSIFNLSSHPSLP